ncbi:amino acid adenylation domain-containing protein [Streptomyces sp. NPDC059649]|uniref:amino acid adenylation domain-containing protein n=1 Tax=Streptomyces sp. NPDC059649 TaxID=3346895 RepID=UPI0036AA6610
MNVPRGPSADAQPAGTCLAPATFPALFEAQARQTPRSTALESADQAWTYQELNEHANRIAHWLIGRGIGPEQRVAVAMPRSAEQLAVLLGVMKAGAAYLPWDLSHPPQRLAYMASDAAPALVLTTLAAYDRLPTGTNTDAVAMDAPRTAAALQTAPASDPDDDVRLSPLGTAAAAYVIYTSGSTGRPKGVTVTHSGLAALRAEAVRHGDLGTDADARVLHFAALTFDMSVWDLVAALTTGATLVVPRQERLIGAELAEVLAHRAVTHATLPPSVLATLPPGSAQRLRNLRALVVGGEALTPALAAEWAPGRRLINAYGPTEATVWATFSPLPDDGTVPIGRAMQDTHAYVLDEHLAPLTDGRRAGELYLAGPGLARGYLGRPALTATRFLPMPFGRPGERMYRTGDMVQIRADGQLEYLGRADDQVKVHGQRIETGEVEAALATHPRVRQAAVVAHQDTLGNQLVGYVVPAPEEPHHEGRRADAAGHIDLRPGLDPAQLRAYLARRLPEAMVPGVVTVVDEMPLTPNGKTDKAALPRPRLHRAPYRAPQSRAEEVLTDAFAKALRTERIGTDDDFFALGGDSIRALQIATQARAHGMPIEPRQIFEHRTVAALADAAQTAGGSFGPAPGRPETADARWLPHLPATRFLDDLGPGAARHAPALVVELPAGMDRTSLTDALRAVTDHHEALRIRATDPQDWGATVTPPGSVAVDALIHRLALPGTAGQEEEWERLLAHELDTAAGRLDPAAGEVMRCVWFDAGSTRPGRLLVALHPLVADAESCRIVASDLTSAARQILDGTPPRLAPLATPLRHYAHTLATEAQRPERVAELGHWCALVAPPDPGLGSDPATPAAAPARARVTSRLTVPPEITQTLLTTLPDTHHCDADDGLLAAFAMALATRRARRGGAGAPPPLVRVTRQGRARAALPGFDLSRTVGPLTTPTPLRPDLSGIDLPEAFAAGQAADTVIASVKQQLRALPDQGIGYGLLRHLNPRTAPVLAQYGSGRISFTHTDRLPQTTTASTAAGTTDLAVTTAVCETAQGPCLEAEFDAREAALSAADIRELADLWLQALQALALRTTQPGAGGLAPSDVTLTGLTQDDIDTWQQAHPHLSDIWPVPPMPQGLLVHSLMEHESGTDADTYQVQYTLHISGPVDPARLRPAAQALLDRHPALRTCCTPGPDGALVQLVAEGVELPWQHLDLSGMDEALRTRAYEHALAADRTTRLDLATPPMLRMTLLTLDAAHHELVITAHHAAVDGWCLPVLLQDLLHLYADPGAAASLPPARSYREYLDWRNRQDTQESARTWAKELAGLTEPTRLTPTADPGRAEEGGIGHIDVPLPADAARALPARAAEAGVTLNTLVQGAWALALSRLTGRQDVVFGAAVAARPATLPGADRMVGAFVNTIPVRVPCDPDASIEQILRDLQQRQAALLEHHHCDLAEIQRATAMPALFDTLVAFESFPLDREALAQAAAEGGVTVTGIGLHSQTHFPVSVFAYPDGTHLRLNLHYQQRLFSPDQAQQIAALYGQILQDIALDVRLRSRQTGPDDPTAQTVPTTPAQPEPPQTAGSDPHRAHRPLERNLGQRIRACAQQLSLPPAVLFHAGWALVSAALNGSDDAVFAGLPGQGPTNGPHGGTRPLHLDLADRSVHDLVHAMDQALRAPADGSTLPPADSALHYRDGQPADTPTPEPAAHNPSPFALTVTIDEHREGFHLQAHTDDSHDPAAVLDCLETAMAGLADSLQGTPGTPLAALRLPVLSDTAHRRLLDQDTRIPADTGEPTCIHRWFENVAAATPDAVAVEFQGRRLSYRELNAQANRLARHLRDLGVGPEARVALRLERTEQLVIAVLAVLKAGGAYVPIDAASPADRLALVLRDSTPRLLLTDLPLPKDAVPPGTPVVDVRADAHQWAALDNTDLTDTGVGPEHAAYVIYTSGSTGVPKGVLVDHRSVTRLFTSTRDLFRFDARDVWLLFHSFTFDVSVFEIWGALLHGATLVVAPHDTARNPKDLYTLLRTSRVTVLNETPTAFQQLIAAQGEDDGPHHLRMVVLAGEALNTALLTPWMARPANRGTQLINAYGPTEATVYTTCHSLTEADTRRTTSLIGRRLTDVRTYVLDRQLKPAPVGATGELYIGGAGAARGYMNRPGLTAQRFVPDPFCGRPGARMYRSGDLVRRLPDGTLQYLGRNDDQVQIRGFRIEPGEIEAALAEHPAVQEARVVVRDHGDGDKRLAAYLVPSAKHAAAVRELLRLESTDPATYATIGELPDGTALFQHDRHETDLAYDEIFVRRQPLRGGITLNNGDTIVDIGAGIGLFTLFAAHRNPDGRIYSCEPTRTRRDALRRNAALHGLNTLVHDHGPGLLPQIIAEQGPGHIDLVRIDEDHAGHDALEGMRPQDWPKIRQLAVTAQDTDHRREKLTQLLTAHGYDVECDPHSRQLTARRPEDRTTRPAPAPAAVEPRRHWSSRSALLDDVRSRLRTVLPEHLLPALYALIEELPMTQSGKLDRTALPEPVPERRGGTPARTPQEQQLCALIAQVLRITQVGMDDNFFDLGGDSLLASRLTSLIGTKLGVTVLIREVYTARDIAALADLVRTAPPARGPRLRRRGDSPANKPR